VQRDAPRAGADVEHASAGLQIRKEIFRRVRVLQSSEPESADDSRTMHTMCGAEMVAL
jgi:hypothetical protein